MLGRKADQAIGIDDAQAGYDITLKLFDRDLQGRGLPNQRTLAFAQVRANFARILGNKKPEPPGSDRPQINASR